MWPNKPPEKNWTQHAYWYKRERGDYEQIMVYVTGRGKYKRQPHARAGRTLYMRGGSNNIRTQVVFSDKEVERYKVKRWNPETQKFDLPYIGGLHALPPNSIVFIDDWTLMEALMRGEINATAAMYNMEGVASNGFALNVPEYHVT